MKTPSKQEPKYEAAQYDGREITVKTVTAEEVRAIDRRKFDHYLSTCDGVWGFRTAKGKWVEHEGKWPGLGPETLDILRVLQLNPGDYLTRAEIAQLTRRDSLKRKGLLDQRICVIRRVHDNSGERFVETRKSGDYSLRWVKERTWLWIDRIPPRPEKVG